MKLLIQSSMIFFGTLMAAAVVALGEPAQAEVALARSAAARSVQPGSIEPADLLAWLDPAATSGSGPR